MNAGGFFRYIEGDFALRPTRRAFDDALPVAAGFQVIKPKVAGLFAVNSHPDRAAIGSVLGANFTNQPDALVSVRLGIDALH